MINVSQYISRFGTRPLLIGVAVVLLLLNTGRFLLGYFEGRQEQLESSLALLEQNRNAVQKLPAMKEKIELLEQQKKIIDAHLFYGASEEQIASSMQIILQEIVGKSELQPESLSPILRGDKQEEKKIKELAIKMRLSGTITGFQEFIANLYQSDKFFKIESFVLKPYRNSELKILIDLKGYYTLEKSTEV